MTSQCAYLDIKLSAPDIQKPPSFVVLTQGFHHGDNSGGSGWTEFLTRWFIMTTKNVKESVKNNAPSELKRKILSLTKLKLRITVCKELKINRGQKGDFLGLYYKIRKISIEGSNLLVKFFTYTSLLYAQIRSASSSELEYLKLFYHLYFFITLRHGLSQKYRTINWMFSKEYSCDKLKGIGIFLTTKFMNHAILSPGLMK